MNEKWIKIWEEDLTNRHTAKCMFCNNLPKGRRIKVRIGGEKANDLGSGVWRMVFCNRLHMIAFLLGKLNFNFQSGGYANGEETSYFHDGERNILITVVENECPDEEIVEMVIG